MQLSKLTRSILKVSVSNVGKGALILLGTVHFTRELGAAAIAPFFLFEAAAGLVSIPADFGLRGATEKRLSEGEREEALLSTVILLKAVPLGVVSLSVVVLSGHVNRYLHAELALLLVVQLALKEYALLLLSTIRGSLQVEKTAVLKFGRYLTWLTAGAVFVEAGHGVEGVVYGAILGSAAMLVGGAVRIPYSLGRPAVELVRSLLTYAKHNFISYIGGYFYSWMDVLILGLFVAPSLVSAYEISWRVTMAVMMFSNAVAVSLFPHVSALDAANDDSGAIERNIANMLLVALLVSVPAFFGSIVYADEILRFVFTIESATAAFVLVILMFEKILQSVHIVIGRSLMGIDRPDLAARATVVAVFANLLFNFALIPPFGILGAAVATTVSFALNMGLHAYYLGQCVPVTIPTWGAAKIVATSGVMLALLYGIEAIARAESLVGLGARIAVGGTVFLLFVGLQSGLRGRMLSIVTEEH